MYRLLLSITLTLTLMMKWRGDNFKTWHLVISGFALVPEPEPDKLSGAVREVLEPAIGRAQSKGRGVGAGLQTADSSSRLLIIMHSNCMVGALKISRRRPRCQRHKLEIGSFFRCISAESAGARVAWSDHLAAAI